MFHIIDKLISKKAPLSEVTEEKFYKARIGIGEKKLENIHYDMDVIDGKSSSLLTHVSIMLAIITVLFGDSKTILFKVLFFIELIGFSFLTLCLLRCIDIMGPPMRKYSSNSWALTKEYLQEIHLRRRLYQFSVRSVYHLTISLIFIITVKTLLYISGFKEL